MSFKQPWFLLLLLQPVLMLLFIKGEEFKLSLYADKKLWPWVIKFPQKNKYRWQKIVFIIAWSLFVVALSGPQIPLVDEITGARNTMRKDVSIMLIINLDSTTKNYDKKMIVTINDFINILKGEKVGIIAVSSDYGLVSPLTTDYDALKFYAKHSFKVVDTKNINLSQKLHAAFNTANWILSTSNATSSAIIYISENGKIRLKGGEIKQLQATFRKTKKNNIRLLPITLDQNSNYNTNTINSIILNSGEQQDVDINELNANNVYQQAIKNLPTSVAFDPKFNNKTELFPYFLLLGLILYSISSIPIRNIL